MSVIIPSPYGPLKTLFLALQASAYMQGVTLAFGEENKRAQELPPPCVVMVPQGGPYSDPEFVRQRDPDTGLLVDIDDSIHRAWQVMTTIELYLWAKAPDGPDTTAIDEADAVETLRVLVCSAFQDQRLMTDETGTAARGLNFNVVSERWETMQDATQRYGRALVLSVQVATPVLTAPQPEATVQTTSFTLGPLTPGPS